MGYGWDPPASTVVASAAGGGYVWHRSRNSGTWYRVELSSWPTMLAPTGKRRWQWGYRTAFRSDPVLNSPTGWAATTSAGLRSSDVLNQSRLAPVRGRFLRTEVISPGFVEFSDAVINARLKASPSVLVGYSLPEGVPKDTNGSIDQEVADDLAAELDGRLRDSRPTKPHASLGVFLAELRDFPKIVGHLTELMTMKALKPGSSYLTYQFGLAPMGRDIAAAATQLLAFQEKWNQFLRDSDRSVRRTASLPPSFSSRALTGPPPIHLNAGQNYDVRAYLERGEELERWDARAFVSWRYHVNRPHDGAFAQLDLFAQKARHLLGLKIGPSEIWALTPWSWMVDWFVDLGSFIGFQEDVADYGLAAERLGYTITKTVTRTATVTVGISPSYSQPPVQTRTATAMYSLEDCIRRPGLSPYGLRVSWESLNGSQLAILAALGLSRRGY